MQAMKKGFSTGLKQLSTVAHRFDEEGRLQKRQCLVQLQKMSLQPDRGLLQYHDLLLFICAHPGQQEELDLAERELKRISALLKRAGAQKTAAFENEGLPYVHTLTRFSHDCLLWLQTHPDCRLEFDSFYQPRADLNDILKLSLPALEKNETTAGLDHEALLEVLQVKPAQRISFMLEQLSCFNRQPLLKDYLFDSMDMYVKLRPGDEKFSRTYNRLPLTSPFFHTEKLRQFHYREYLDASLPAPVAYKKQTLDEAIRVVKNAMALTARETDPSTYLDPKSFRLYELERGVSVAIYGMCAERLLPLESYVGFTLFKNGFPASYGGAWVMGAHARFGINIFEAFRGGESGFMMCQVLRVYRQVFGVEFFEIEPYQFGLDNPDGIRSGAFWFYYKHGFRPLDKKLKALAEAEYHQIKKKPGYRSTEQVLLRFTESNMGLQLGDHIPADFFAWAGRVKKMISRRYAGKRAVAEQDCIQHFRTQTQMGARLNDAEQQALSEMALLAGALELKKAESWQLLKQMVQVKPRDVYQYQSLLKKLMGSF